MYEIIGMFNSVDEWEGLDVATGEKPPGFGKKSFSMTYETYHKCGAVGSNSACFSPLYSTPHGRDDDVQPTLPPPALLVCGRKWLFTNGLRENGLRRRELGMRNRGL